MAKEQNNTRSDIGAEIDLLDLGRKVWSRRKMVIRYAVTGAVAGLIIGFSIPRTYTTTVRMAPESKSGTSGGGATGLAAMMGVNLGQAAGMDGITAALYPDIVRSTPFLLEFADMPIRLKPKKNGPGEQMILFDYMTEHQKHPWWSSIFSFPGKLIGWIGSIGREEPSFQATDSVDMFDLPLAYKTFVDALSLKISVDIDGKSSLIQASVVMQDPFVSALVADSLVSKLQKYMTVYKTQKTRQDLEMSIRQHEEARESYYAAEDLLAAAVDRNRTISSESLRIRIERLRNERNVAYSVYNQTASQVEMNRIKLVEDMPIATVVEPAIVPQQASAPRKTMIFISFSLLGVLAAVGMIVARNTLKGFHDL